MFVGDVLSMILPSKSWMMKSNRTSHFDLGFKAGFVGTVLAAVGAALGAEYKDKMYGNKFDWLDVLATVLGGITGQIMQVGVIYAVYMMCTH